MIQAGIIGSGGYVAGELIRCLVQHPEVSVDFVYSNSQAGKRVVEVHQDMFTNPELHFTHQVNPNVDIVFLCLGHGNSRRFLQEQSFSANTRIVDLSNDFRLQKDADDFVYGLVELNKASIQNAQRIANPGCFATAIQLGLLPLAKAGLLKQDVHVHAVTGSTGAGQSLTATSHFSWRNNNLSAYKEFSHQHLGEIGESIVGLQPDFGHSINFIPLRGDFPRGIFATAYSECALSEQELTDLYQSYYQDAAFAFITDRTVHLKQVANTNNCLIQVQKIDGKVLVTSVIDNLLKGAAGQAIQNMNLMFGLEEKTGLNLKATYF